MTTLPRPLTLSFQTPKVGRLTEQDILNELIKHIEADDIKCIQLTAKEGWVTLVDENRRNQLAARKVTIKGKSVEFQNPALDITNATIKDAPIELPDTTIEAALSAFGRVIPESMRTGKIFSQVEDTWNVWM